MMTAKMTPSRDIARLIEIMAALRTPVTGCPWDLAQNFTTIAPYTLEEAYEVADAIERGDLADLKDELGDLLLQVVYHARMAEETGAFEFGDVVEGVTRKMIRRHPHVFGNESAGSPGDVDGLWARIKAEEKAEKAAARRKLSPTLSPSPQGGGGSASSVTSILADVPNALPALTRAIKLQDKAAKVGFDWPSLMPVFDKLREELAELEEVALPHDPRAPLPSPQPGAEDGSTSLPLVGRARVGGFRDEADGLPRTALSGIPLSAPAGTPPTTPSVVSPTANPSPQGGGEHAIFEELGDLLFVMVNVARHLRIDPEAALRAANQKFVRRFTYIEQRLAAQGSSPAQSSLTEMDDLWDEAKAREKGA
jgi:ATP diphosphatase